MKMTVSSVQTSSRQGLSSLLVIQSMSIHIGSLLMEYQARQGDIEYKNISRLPPHSSLSLSSMKTKDPLMVVDDDTLVFCLNVTFNYPFEF